MISQKITFSKVPDNNFFKYALILSMSHIQFTTIC